MISKYIIQKNGRTMSFYERSGYTVLLVDTVYYRNQVLNELARIGYENDIHAVRVPGADAMAISFPASVKVAFNRIYNQKLFGWT